MKKGWREVWVLMLVMGSLLFFAEILSGASNSNVAEICTIHLDGDPVEKTEEMRHYEAVDAKSDAYVRIPRVRTGTLLDLQDIIETISDQLSTRIEFTADQYLLLGTGTEEKMDCLKVMDKGNTCARARFEGFDQGQPFWYLKNGAAFVENMVLADGLVKGVFPTGTAYLFSSMQAKTVIHVVQGEVRVKVRNRTGEIKLREHEELEVTQQGNTINIKTNGSRRLVDDVYRWINQGLIVIREPRSDETEQSAIRLQGTVSSQDIPELAISEVEVLVNGRPVTRTPVINGAFATDLALAGGQNTVQVRAVNRYGELSDTTMIVRKIRMVTVPDFRGFEQADIASILARQELTLGSLTFEAGGIDMNGKVLRQTPANGAQVPEGSAIDVVIGGCPDPAVQSLDFLMLQQTRDQQGKRTGKVRMTGVIKNIGTASFESRSGQQAICIFIPGNSETGEISRQIACEPFQNLAVGQAISIVYNLGITSCVGVEFCTHPVYELIIKYNSDILNDGNFKNDDCVNSNNIMSRGGQVIEDLFQ